MRRISFFVLFALWLGMAVACTPKGPENEYKPRTDKDKPGKETEVKVESLSLSPQSITLELGEKATLTLVVTPADAVVKNVEWISSNPNVVTVSNGKIQAVREGAVTITARVEDKIAACEVTVRDSASEKIKTALMKIYNAMDGPNWNLHESSRWDMSNSLNNWQGVEWNNNELRLLFQGQYGFHLKGELPDCFEDLTECVAFSLSQQEDVTGTLPQSFSQLKHLKILTLESTSMTSLPDIFGGMPLFSVFLSNNPLMEGPLPETLGESDDLMSDEQYKGYWSGLTLSGNGFTGTIPQSWLRLGYKVDLYSHKLTGQIPEYFYTDKNAAFWINTYIDAGDVINDPEFRKNDPFRVNDVDIPAYWPERGLNDVITGQPIPYKEIVSANRATVILKWASWCPYSAALLPRLKLMYEKYHKDGLEIIARPAWGDDDGVKTQKTFLEENGYDAWYNFSPEDITFVEEAALGRHSTPFAKVVDNNGNIIFSTNNNVMDQSRARFNYVASTDLIPFLEDIFGPLEEEDDYSSTDYSKDGQVMTLQRATVGNGINLVFMGDAYTDRDMDIGGFYENLMFQAAEEFFAIEPYKTFRNRFNVYAVKVVSKHGKSTPGHDTALGVQATSSSITTGNEDKCYEYALKVPGINSKDNLTIAVLVNSMYDRGITAMKEQFQSGIGFCASCLNNYSAYGPVIRHEVGGHAFAFLADEYGTTPGAPSQESIDYYNRMYNLYGWYSNVDFTSDPSSIKWSAFLSDERYANEVGIFEGGANYTNGVYRPSSNGMMKDELEYYNAPSRWAIYKRIMELSGETASFERFLEYDAVNR